jgi:isopenicillin-N N-acyltransferase like protein
MTVRMTFVRRHKKKLAAVATLLLAGPVAHVTIVVLTPMPPPAVALPEDSPTDGPDGIRRMGASYTRSREGLREVYLEGSPERIGASHVRLLRDRMVANEAELWGTFAHVVPFAPARTLLTDLGRARYHHVDRGFPEARRREVAAEARAFAPDPFEDRMPTYQRMVFLHALYDIALGFEHSPLLGCSSFGLGPDATADGHPLLARAFDFEAGDIFDRDKAVFFVRGEGVLPFASVAWPGLVGVMSGMNLEGVAVVVHGGRARDVETTGEPVIFMLREVLERAHDVAEAVLILRAQSVMASHIVFVGDARGRFAIVERAPGAEATVRDTFPDPARVAVTNHFEGPLASDEKNQAIRAHTTTLPRRARLDEMLAKVLPKDGTVERAVSMLRDHDCAGGEKCELGDRRSIDALIATHGVVCDLQDRVLWVSAGPHLSGKFVRFDLKQVFATGHDPATDPPAVTLPEDPLLFDGRYEKGRARAGGPRVGGNAQ